MRAARILIAVLRPICWLLFPYTVRGREHIPAAEKDQRLILCANHLSLLDPVFLLVTLPQHIYFMAKEESFRPAIGRFIFGKVMGAFPVKRGEADRTALDTAMQLVNDGKVLGIFPEGTRSKEEAVGRFKSGAALIAAQTGASILPVSIYTKGGRVRLFKRTVITYGEVIPRGELQPEEEKPNLRHMTRMLKERVDGLFEEGKASCR